jgi:hypothetical protein
MVSLGAFTPGLFAGHPRLLSSQDMDDRGKPAVTGDSLLT